MAIHEFPPGSSLLGWYLDGLPEELSPTRPVMLRNDDGRVSVTMLFDHNEDLRRYFYGPKDPRTKLLDPPVPTTGHFQGPDGSVALAGGVYLPGTFGTGGHSGRIYFSRAILGGSGLKYERINGLAADVQFLQAWMCIAGPEPSLIRDEGGRVRGVHVEASEEPSIRLAPRLNLSVSRNFLAEPDPDGWWVRSPIALETSVMTPRPWADHAMLIRRVSDLITIASGQPTGIQRVWATAEHDPLRTLDGRAHGPTARLVLTQDFPEATDQKYPQFLFTFADIGSRGVSRWMALHDGAFHTALDAIRGTFRPNGMGLESQFGLAALAVERVGYALGIESGAWKKGDQPPFAHKALAIASVVPGLDSAAWIPNLTKMYRAHKHPDHPEPEGDQMMKMLKSTRALLRAWAAVRLGAAPEGVVERLGGPTGTHPDGGEQP